MLSGRETGRHSFKRARHPALRSHFSAESAAIEHREHFAEQFADPDNSVPRADGPPLDSWAGAGRNNIWINAPDPLSFSEKPSGSLVPPPGPYAGR